MMTLITVFGVLVAVIAVVGAMRGWAKELINTFGIVLALFLYDLLVNQIPFTRQMLDQITTANPTSGQETVFFVLAGMFLLVVLFSYLGPVAARVSGGRLQVKARETMQDALLGLLIGVVNGYLIVGTLWFFLEITNYPFPPTVLTRPVAGTTSAAFVQYLPLVYLTPWLKFLLPAAFLMLIIMFV